MDGLSLYLASGTDTEDVVAEAQALGYAHCFNGGIRGSVGDPESDPKRVVVQEILCEAEAGDRVLVIGDGPVEVREITRRGGYAVGAISDEVRRYGRNLAKRPRLVLAGADLLIGDFTWRDELVELLFPGRSSRA
jgi:phosphoglycolate phosphatase-like HAD superfamily hydrolase